MAPWLDSLLARFGYPAGTPMSAAEAQERADQLTTLVAGWLLAESRPGSDLLNIVIPFDVSKHRRRLQFKPITLTWRVSLRVVEAQTIPNMERAMFQSQMQRPNELRLLPRDETRTLLKSHFPDQKPPKSLDWHLYFSNENYIYRRIDFAQVTAHERIAFTRAYRCALAAFGGQEQ